MVNPTSNTEPSNAPNASPRRKRWWLRITACLLLLVVACALTLRIALVNLDAFLPQSERWLSKMLDQPVRIGNIESQWSGWTLMMRFHDISMLDRKQRDPMLELKNARLDIDLWETFSSGHLSPGKLIVTGARLAVTRRRDGSFAAKGLDRPRAESRAEKPATQAEDPLIQWIFSRGKLDLEDASIVWDDRRSRRGPIVLSDVQLQLRIDGEDHKVLGSASLPEQLGESLNFAIELLGDPFSDQWAGSVKLQASHINVSGLPATPHPSDVISGYISAELNTHWKLGYMTDVTGEVVLNGITLARGIERSQLDTGRLNIKGTRRDEGWAFSLSADELTTANGPWPRTSGTIFVSEPRGGRRSASGQLNFLRIEDIAPLAMAFAPPDLPNAIRATRPSGTLTDIQFEIETDANRLTDLSIKTNVEDLSTPARGSVPGIKGLSGYLELTGERGLLKLDSEALRVNVPGTFAVPLNAHAEGELTWQRKGTGWWFDLNGIGLSNQNFQVQLGGKMHWPYQNRTPIVDLALSAKRADLAQLQTFLPLGLMKPALAGWLRRAVAQGQLTSAQISYAGYGGDFPFRGAEGAFQMQANIKDVDLKFSPRWPLLENLDAAISVDGKSMTITPHRAEFQGATMKTGNGFIGDLTLPKPVIEVEGVFAATARDGLIYLREGNLKERFGALASGLESDGPMEVDVSISVAVPRGEKRYSGVIRLDNNNVLLKALKTELGEASGQMEFTSTGVTSSGVKAKYLGIPVDITADKHPQRAGVTRVQIKGIADNGFLTRQLHALRLFADPADPPRVMSKIRGRTGWTAWFDLPRGWGQPGTEAPLVVRSDLRGLALNLPPPFDKPKDEPQSFEVATVIKQDKSDRLVTIQYGPEIGSVFRLRAGPSGRKLERGAVVFGNLSPELPPNRGLHVGGNLSQFSIDDWKAVTEDPTDQAESGFEEKDYPILRVLEEIEVRARLIEFLGQNFENTHLVMKRDKQRGFNARIRGDSIAGEIRFPPRSAQRDPIVVDLERLELRKRKRSNPPGDPRRAPPLEFSTRQLEYGKLELGPVELSTTPLPDGLAIESLKVTGDGFETSSMGSWTYIDEKHLTQIETHVAAPRLGALLTALGYKGASDGAETDMDIELAWPGAPAEFSLATVDGVVQLNASEGRLLDVNPGAAGRLFGSLLLTTLPRRLRLDFSDIFGEGIEFNSIEGSFALANGHAFTNNLGIDASSARIDIAGRTGLVAEDYDQIVTVTPKLSSSLPFAPLWLIEKVFKKNLLDKVFAYRYTITGPWSEPNIERVIVETTLEKER